LYAPTALPTHSLGAVAGGASVGSASRLPAASRSVRSCATWALSAASDPQAGRIVRLRFFAGLSGDETAAVLGISPSSVDREWAYARARLQRLLHE